MKIEETNEKHLQEVYTLPHKEAILLNIEISKYTNKFSTPRILYLTLFPHINFCSDFSFLTIEDLNISKILLEKLLIYKD